jgi:hypothetical protein
MRRTFANVGFMGIKRVFYFRFKYLNWKAKMGGAACVTRTRDPIITNDVLYQLS